MVVEKLSIFSILTELDFHSTYCIIVYKLRRTFFVPIYGFVDGNPAGVRILCTFKFGSERRAFDNLELTVPDLNWVGLYGVDMNGKPGLSVLNEDDYAILVNLLNLPHIQSEREWHRNLCNMLELGLKGDIERVLDYHEIEAYLSERIPEMDKTKY